MANKPRITAGFITVFCSMSMISTTLCSHFSSQGSYYDYTHAWTKLHTEVMSWIWCLWVSLCMALTWSELNYCAWFVPSVSSLPLSVMVRSRIQYIHRRGVRWWEIHRVNFHERALVHVQIWNVRIRSFNLNLQYMATCKQMDKHTHASCNAWIYIITVCVQTPSLPYLSWLL